MGASWIGAHNQGRTPNKIWHCSVFIVLTVIFELRTGPIKGMVNSGEPLLDPSKLINLIVFDPPWVYEALGDILTRIVSKSHFAKPLVARDITIFDSYLIFNFPK